MFEFAWPWMFLLLPLPWLSYRCLRRAELHGPALLAPFVRRFSAGAAETRSHSRVSVAAVLLLIGWIALLCAAAKPQRSGDPIPLPREGRDLMLAMDISDSMQTADMLVERQLIPRLVIVKYILSEFLKKREGDRVGLILFGSQAYLQAPLTFDLKTVDVYLQETALRLAGMRTAIGDAIGLAVKRLQDRPSSQRVLILLTDGQNTAGNIEPRKAADLAKQAGVKIYTVGVGAENTLQYMASDLDEETLQYVASSTGGKYYRARNPAELLAIYEELDKIEQVEQDANYLRPVESLYYYPLAVSLFAIMLLQLLWSLRRRGVELV